MSDPSETGPKSLEDRHGFNRFKANVSRDVLNRIILILSILTGLGLIATVFIFQKKTGSAAMLLALLATLIAAKLWMRRGQLRSAAVLMIAGVWLVFGVNILLGGGVHNINAVFFLVLTVIAGLLLGEQATFWVAAVSIAALFGLALLGFFNLLPSPYFVESHLGNLVQLIFALVTTAGALNLALSARDDALGMAHERLADQLKTRQALQESERKHRELVDFLPVAVFESDFEGNVLSGNLAIREMFGFSQADYEKGLNGFEMIHPDDRERAAQNLQALLRGDKKDPFSEYTALRKDGTAFPCAFFTSVILEEEKPVGFRGAIIDLSGQKQAREDLRRAEEKYRTIIEQMVEGYFELDLAGNYTFANDAECKIAGCSREELIGMNNRQYQDEENAQKTYQVFNRIYKTGQTVKSLEVEIIRKDGTKGFNEISVSLKRDAEGRPIGFRGFTRDVTERRRAEETLRLSEERFRGITSNLPGGVYQFFARRNGDMRLNYVSENAQTLLGLPHDPEQFFPRLSACVAPEDRERFFESINEAIRTVSKWNFEGRYIKPTGEEIYLKGISAPIEMEDGLIFNGVILDITDRKRAEAEKQRLEERLRRAEKMEALGQLAGGVAHDLNNVLGVLSGYSELLLAEIPEGQKARKHVEKILQSTAKGAAIIQDLLTLARRGVLSAEVVQINEIISGFTKTPAFENIRDYHPGVTFRTECDPNLLNIKGSPVHLEKTLMNLVSNATEAISGEGEVIIRTENRYLDKAVVGYDRVKEGDYVVLIVSDTGAGIADEHREKIFEPFYTKKAMGRSGTGLGLSIVWGTVKDHNGYIDVKTKVGEGTSFTLYFPATREETGLPTPRTPLERYMGRGETVLVVDDVAEQRDVASGLLQKLGYKVHSVAGGEEALEYLKKTSADILILDMIMAPGMDGMETYQKILEINPKQKAILVSGFSETDRVRTAQRLGAGTYVKKPYAMETIGLAIRKELDRC